MNEVQLELNRFKQGRFFINDDGQTLAEMRIGISAQKLIAYHTEAFDRVKGKGTGKILLDEMVRYAREHHLKVAALCPYVHAQFSRHPELYEDIWLKSYKDQG
jgi:predicted GNAT family acetyltransferase